MVKGNNMLPNGHFHKDWQRRVKTWFAQPSRKLKRRQVRAAKASRLAPRPLNLLRPGVRGQTIKYNARIRAGRGFTLEELKAAGINQHQAPTIGISVDHRRKNRSEEAFQLNVNRLKVYKNKLVIFPRHCSKKLKKGDAKPEDLKAVSQNKSVHILPLPTGQKRLKARVITKEERVRTVTKILRKAHKESKYWGIQEKLAKRKAEGKGKKKKTKDEGDD
jgi:large subunit ribosomal protein L13e